MIVGVDGCRAGWLAVIWQETIAVRLCKNISDILALPADFIAIDMPIGFPEFSETGGRLCDRLARKYLGQRQSSLFAVPCRATVMAETYAEACAENLKASNPPRKISKQIFYLFPKMRELDAALSHFPQKPVAEVHPELAFTRMNDGEPLELPKKIKGKPNKDGLILRRNLLARSGFPVNDLTPPSQKGFGEDDLLDAAACAWSAARLATDKALRLPEIAPQDQSGRPMQISA